MADSIFTQIINGEIPSYKIYEDDYTIAILNIHQTAVASVLVVPKKQVEDFYDLPNIDYSALMLAVKKVAKRMKEILNTKKIGIKVLGLDIPHVHIHLIAFNKASEYYETEDFDSPIDTDSLNKLRDLLSF